MTNNLSQRAERLTLVHEAIERDNVPLRYIPVKELIKKMFPELSNPTVIDYAKTIILIMQGDKPE